MLDAASRTDELTRLANRRDLEVRLARTRVGDTLVMCDLDHFKRAERQPWATPPATWSCGTSGRCCSGALRGDDYAARYGGEEFVLVLAETDAQQSLDVLVRLRRRWADVAPGDHLLRRLRHAHRHAERGRAAGQAADQAMYAAKSSGRDCFRGVDAPGRRLNPWVKALRPPRCWPSTPGLAVESALEPRKSG